MRKILGETWTLAGVLLVIITLSGPVRQQAIYISGIALLFWFAGLILDSNDDTEDSDSDDQ